MSLTPLFILDNDEVLGPFTEAEVDERLAQGDIENPLVWWRGLPEWLPNGEWKSQFSELQKKTLAKAERMWKVRIASGEAMSMTQKHMLDFLKHESDLASIEIWTEGYDDYHSVYQILPIMDELGISRRQHPRVPLSGSITVQRQGEDPVEAQPKSLSEGGLGLNGIKGLEIGERVNLTLKSPQLYQTIQARAEVVFSSSAGIVGLRFESLGSEAKSAIIEYVKKFTNQSTRS